MYAMEAYINPDPYTIQSVEITPSETPLSPADADTPVTQASTPSSSRGSSPTEVSECATPRCGSSTRDMREGFEHGTTGRRSRKGRYAPYSKGARPGSSISRYTTPSTSCILGEEAFGPHASRPPEHAAYLESPFQKIQDELELLSTKLGRMRVKQVNRHPYLTCPIFDCDRGGFNELLHGITSALAITTDRASSLATAASTLGKSSSIRMNADTH
jgi:hypothetical protein